MVALSILIPTTNSRRKFEKSLLTILCAQIKNKPVELVVNRNERDNIGKKRNDMVNQAKGEYVIHLDVDDWIPKDYVENLLKAIETKPDCVGISGYMTTNGKNKKFWHISKDFEGWYEKDNVYYRSTNHITAVKREIALKVPFPEVKQGEDYAYSMALREHLKTEVKIEGIMYGYIYVTKKNY